MPSGWAARPHVRRGDSRRRCQSVEIPLRCRSFWLARNVDALDPPLTYLKATSHAQRIVLQSASHAARWMSSPDTAVIWIRGGRESKTKLSTRYGAILRLVLDDTSVLAVAAAHATTITAAQAVDVAALVRAKHRCHDASRAVPCRSLALAEYASGDQRHRRAALSLDRAECRRLRACPRRAVGMRPRGDSGIRTVSPAGRRQ